MNQNNTQSACACMGPQLGEPYCPCEMSNRGLPRVDNSKEIVGANERLSEAFAFIFDYRNKLNTVSENKC
jgi:hypothetical protein